MVRLLTNEEVEQTVSMRAIIDELEELYRQLGEGTALTRPRTDVHSPAANDGEYYRFKTMGGLFPLEEVYALRINSDVLRWVDRDGDVIQEKLPRARGDRYVGFVILFDAGDGTPLAIMPDGYVQKLRVGATSAIGAKYLGPPGTATLGLLGAGWQAQGQVAALTEIFDLDSVRVYTPSNSREEFAATVEDEYGIDARAVEEPEAVFEADLVHAATNSRSPVFDVDWLQSGTHLGAINPLEIDPAAPEACDVTVVHSKAGKEAEYWTADVDPDDIPYLEADRPDYEQFPDLGTLIAGDVEGRTDPDQTTFFFNNIGMGAQFAAVGALAYQAASDADIGTELDTELFTQDMVP